MLVNNPCVNDARVLRAAEVASEAGFETIVLAHGTGAEADEEHVNGFRLRRLRESGASTRTAPPPGSTAFLSQLVRKGKLWFLQTAIETSAYKSLFGPELKRLKPDVIHAHDLAPLPAAAAAAAETGALLIYDSHELEAHRLTRAGFVDTWLRRHIERAHIAQADAVITVSDSIAQHLANAYSISLPIVVMNSPKHSDTRADAGDLRADLGLGAEVPLAVYVGKLTMSRGLEQAIEALRYWPELHLALIGPEHAPTVRRLRRLVSRFKLEPRVHFVPPVASEHVTSYVASADVGIVPIQNACLSYYYSLPNKLLESTFARLPLAVSDFPEFRRFLRLSESGIVMDERSPKDIARAVREVYLRQREFRADAETLRKVEAVYGWPRQKEVLMHLYRSLRVACEERTPRRID